MRLWPFFRRRKPCASPDAEAANVEAERALTDAKALTSRADSIADRLAKTKARNNFAASVARSFRGA